MNATPNLRGQAIAAALAGGWRAAAPPLEMRPEQLGEIAPMLLDGGAAGLVWRRLPGGALRNSAAGRALKDAYIGQAVVVERNEHILADAVTRLRAAGIEPILIKGWVAAHLYPDLALRPYSDFDLCVDPQQFEAAQRVVQLANGKLVDVELHEGIPDLQQRSWAEIKGRSRRLALSNIIVHALSFEDQLHQLCIHYLRHSALKPLWLCDIAAAIEQLPASFDWHYFRGKDACAAQWAMCFLGLACRLLEAKPTSPEIERAAQSVPAWMIDNVLWRWGNGLERTRLAGLLKHPSQLSGVFRHHWLNRMMIAYRSHLAPDQSLAVILAHAALQQPIKAALRLRRIFSTRLERWASIDVAPCNLHPGDASRYC